MGKKKTTNEVKQTTGNEDKSQKSKDKRNYTLEHIPETLKDASAEDSDVIKVSLPVRQEGELVTLIQNHKSRKKLQGSASQRVTTKKLSDMYDCLSRAGFKTQQIEQAMANTVQYGGDLLDALDWLCLHLNHDQLPEGFSDTLSQEENKRRPKFDLDLQDASIPVIAAAAAAPPDVVAAPMVPLDQVKEKKETSDAGGMKDWILQYAQGSSDDNDDDGSEDDDVDPNKKYLELTDRLIDLQTQAVLAKNEGDKTKHKECGKIIRNVKKDMADMENHPAFKESTKVEGLQMEALADEKARKVKGQRLSVDPKPAAAPSGGNNDDQDFGLANLEAQAAEEKPKKKSKTAKYDKRNFEYTRQQWTGKSPKQFLIDWVRKNLKSSPQPTYEKVDVGGNLWRARCKIVRKGKEGDLIVTPEIVTANIKEAEHLASVLALWNLCKGQKIYSLLPPPYRDVWLEWESSEKQAKEKQKTEENKPRDQFVSKLLKKLKIDDRVEVKSQQEEEMEASWEDMLSDEEDSSPRKPTKKRAENFNLRAAQQVFKKRQESEPYQKLLTQRQQLPVYAYRESILEAVRQENVLVIEGQTGSGKSTQIPQFLLESYLSELNKSGVACNIVVTEPRRISATSLATRVSQELGEPRVGERDSFVGYQIRMETKRSNTTRLMYCTTGVLMRRLQSDLMLSDVTHVFVDEVHERNVECDFLLILLKRILEKRRDFKVVLMSATVDSQKFSAYFNHCPVFSIPGRTFPVQVHYLEDILEMTSYTLEDDSPYAQRYHHLVEEESTTVNVTGKGGLQHSEQVSWTKTGLSDLDTTDLDTSQFSKKTRNTISRLNQDRINMELLIELLRHLVSSPDYNQVDGAVLVFLPGLAHIQELNEALLGDSIFGDSQRFRIIALHSVLSSENQSAAFDIPPPGVRKIVLSTNIAETGVTIPDVVFVVDSGKVKENRYMETTQMSTLEEVFVSAASAKQRQGRAGRVRDGFCFRLFTKAKFESLKSHSVPEILRVPLEELCLHIMKSELGHPQELLSQALDAPSERAVSRAMSILRQVGACQPDAPLLTPLGNHLVALPVNVRIGKMLVFGGIFGCLDAVCVIGASISDKSAFSVPVGQRDQADTAKQSLATASSDHITLYKAYLGWKAAKAKGRRAESDYCQKYFLKRNTLLDIENTANDLKRLVKSIGFTCEEKASENIRNRDTAMIKAVLTAAFYPNVAKTLPAPQKVEASERQVCHCQTSQGHATVHPSSVNRFLGANSHLIYVEKIRSRDRVYLRDCSLTSPYSILLFGGDIDVLHRQQLVVIDKWIKYKTYARTGVIFKELRHVLDDLLQQQIDNPELKVTDDPVVTLLQEILTAER